MSAPALMPELAARFERDGYLLLRGAIPVHWLGELRAVFDAGSGHNWPVPRGRDWRHAYVETAPIVQSVCRVPLLLAAAGQLIGAPFFLAQVEGREPLSGGGAQTLHRDGKGNGSRRILSALAFLDDYGPQNGATRIVPGSHVNLIWDAASTAQVMAGKAGDILAFDADLLHGGTCNKDGGRRRSLLINFFHAGERDAHEESRALRNVLMPLEIFTPRLR